MNTIDDKLKKIIFKKLYEEFSNTLIYCSEEHQAAWLYNMDTKEIYISYVIPKNKIIFEENVFDNSFKYFGLNDFSEYSEILRDWFIHYFDLTFRKPDGLAWKYQGQL